MKFVVFLFVLFTMPYVLAQDSLTRILFILDASNSMNNSWGKKTRIVAAKELLAKSVSELEDVPNLELALRVYGHQSDITPTYQDCEDTKLEIPFAQNNHREIKTKVQTIQARGTTPIARSLEAAATDFPDTKARNVIILITDGLEACDNDPCVIAKKLKDKEINVRPFVIGVGMDLSYLENFRCIGEYAEAETPDAFAVVLKNVVNKALLNTTAQINLNNITNEPKETDVTLFLYQHQTNKLHYTFTHTLNRNGLPDTVIIDPDYQYDMIVNTLPKKTLKNIKLKRNTHNVIEIDVPQGYIQVRILNGQRTLLIPTRIMEHDKSTTLNVQQLNETDKYIIGKYDLEILTLPRNYRTVEVRQSAVTKIDIPAPGFFQYKATGAITGQLFTILEDGTFEWVANLDDFPPQNTITLQPGTYKLVYRYKHIKSTIYTSENEFRIYSNKTHTINL